MTPEKCPLCGGVHDADWDALSDAIEATQARKEPPPMTPADPIPPPVTPLHDPEIIICAAVICEGGYIQRGHRHHDAMEAARKAKRWPQRGAVYQGFITSRNRFVSRSEAMDLQVAAGLGSADTEHNPDGQLRGNELYSEDLY